MLDIGRVSSKIGSFLSLLSARASFADDSVELFRSALLFLALVRAQGYVGVEFCNYASALWRQSINFEG